MFEYKNVTKVRSENSMYYQIIYKSRGKSRQDNVVMSIYKNSVVEWHKSIFPSNKIIISWPGGTIKKKKKINQNERIIIKKYT